MKNDSSIPEALLAEISRDLKPVRPAPVPSSLAVRVAPFAALAAFSILALMGMRSDAASLGPLVTWGASIAQFGLGIVLVWIAAREGNPARQLPERFVWCAVAATFLVLTGIVLWTAARTANPVRIPFSPLVAGLFCGAGATIMGGLLTASVAFFFRQSLAVRPAAVGALFGFGAGVTVNAGWRLACPNSTPMHAIGAHGAAVVLTALLGAVTARWIARRARARM